IFRCVFGQSAGLHDHGADEVRWPQSVARRTNGSAHLKRRASMARTGWVTDPGTISSVPATCLRSTATWMYRRLVTSQEEACNPETRDARLTAKQHALYNSNSDL